tara:strand:- start:202 stop:441 length:240 start_codon:yes stop_codon:yes gene_type:complete
MKYRTSKDKAKYKLRRYVDGKNADNRIKYCNKCKKCWEGDYYALNKNIPIIHYDDFPSYGKKIETCDDCKTNSFSENIK